MEMLSRTPPPSKPSKSWPHAPAVRGEVYGVPDPVFQNTNLVVMAHDTWLDYGTAVERMRRDAINAVEAGNKLKLAYDIAVRELAELREKHNNLRAAEKRRRKAALGFKGFIDT